LTWQGALAATRSLINDGGDCRTAPATPGLLKKSAQVQLVQV